MIHGPRLIRHREPAHRHPARPQQPQHRGTTTSGWGELRAAQAVSSPAARARQGACQRATSRRDSSGRLAGNPRLVTSLASVRLPSVRKRVDLSGHHSNPQAPLEGLLNGASSRGKASRERSGTCATEALGGALAAAHPRRGRIIDAISEVLIGERDPMQARDVHARVETLLVEPVRWSSVKATLAGNLTGPTPDSSAWPADATASPPPRQPARPARRLARPARRRESRRELRLGRDACKLVRSRNDGLDDRGARLATNAAVLTRNRERRKAVSSAPRRKPRTQPTLQRSPLIAMRLGEIRRGAC